ncbi:MAG: GAF domain-containing protein, partial [Phycisphaerae bacterium]
MELAHHNFPPETLGALAEASNAINSTLKLDVVLDQIAASAARVMRAEAASVLMLDRRRGMLVFAAAFGKRGRSLIGKEFDAKLGIAGHVLQTGNAQNVAEAASDPDFFRGIDDEADFQTRGLIAAPMVFKSDTIGVIEVLNRVGGGRFDHTDLKLLTIFANLA